MEISQIKKNYPRCLSARSTSSKRSKKSSVSQISQKYDNIKENQLTWLFNRRKEKLKQTSQQNIAMYLRILEQKTIIKGFDQQKSKSKKKTYIRKRIILNKQNFDVTIIDKQISKRANQISAQVNGFKINNMLRF